MVAHGTSHSLASGSSTIKAISSLRFTSIGLAALHKQGLTASSLGVESLPPES